MILGNWLEKLHLLLLVVMLTDELGVIKCRLSNCCPQRGHLLISKCCKSNYFPMLEHQQTDLLSYYSLVL